MSKLTDNTSGLQTILEALQHKAAGGGGVETCEVEVGIGSSFPLLGVITYLYTDEDFNFRTISFKEEDGLNTVIIRPVKNSIILTDNLATMGTESETIIQMLVGSLGNSAFGRAFLVTGNGQLLAHS